MTNTNHAVRLLLLAVTLASGLGSVGCGKKFRFDYGQSRGAAGDQSINGFGALRRTYKNSGWSTRDVNRLNDRLSSTTAIVWTPTQRDTLFDQSTKWFDEWLREQTRTLVYVVPDQGCKARYFEVARQVAPDAQKLEYRRQLARVETDQMLVRFNGEPIPSNGWFQIERTPSGTTYGSKSVNKPKGEWMRFLPVASAEQSIDDPDIDDTDIEYKIEPVLTATATIATAATISMPTMFGQTYGTSQVTPTHTTLVSADDGSPIITRLTSKEWGQSKVIVVGNGSMLCNFSLTAPQGQAIATQLIAETGDTPGLVGFLTTDGAGAQVSDVNPEINSLTGAELFSVWPLSLIIMHLAITGFVACMILFPIFGRPRRSESTSNSDFASHLDAVAVLMSRSGGEQYARHRVSEYMRRIRGETSGTWVIPDPELKPSNPFANPPPSGV